MSDRPPCPLLLAQVEDNRAFRATYELTARELYRRTEELKAENAAQTLLLQSNNDMLTVLVSQHEKTFRLYRWVEGIGKLAGIVAGAVLVVAALLEVFKFFGINRGG